MITVIDTSTWVDARVFGGFEEEAVIKAFTLGVVAGCKQLWQEIHWVLTRKYGFPATLIANDLAMYWLFSIDVEIDGSIRGCSDPNDDFILECAVRSKARVIVSNDRKHLVSMRSFECIPIITPEEYLMTDYPVGEEEILREYALTKQERDRGIEL